MTLNTCPFISKKSNASYLNQLLHGDLNNSRTVNRLNTSKNSTDDAGGNSSDVGEISYIRGKILYFVAGFVAGEFPSSLGALGV